MTVTPQGQLYLCKTPLEDDSKNQINFANATAQYNYFYSTIVHTFDNYTYIKKDNSVNVGKNIDEIIDCNYLFYRNVGFSSKWYYCYITNMEYVNENCTKIYFRTDSFQSYQFDIVYHPCFVEREHVNDDTIGLHTVPEGLEHGEYVHNNFSKFGLCSSPSDLCVVIASTIDFFNWDTEAKRYPQSSRINGIFSGIAYYIMHDPDTIASQHYDSAAYFLQSAAGHGQTEAIQGVFLVPKVMVNYSSISWDSPETRPFISFL